MTIAGTVVSPERFCRLEATVSGDEHILLVDQNRSRKTELTHARSDFADLPLRVRPRVFGFALMRLIGTMTWVGCTICPSPEGVHQDACLPGINWSDGYKLVQISVPLGLDLGHPPRGFRPLYTNAQGLPIPPWCSPDCISYGSR